MASLLKVFKVTAIPSTLVADAIYVVAHATDATLAEIYITNSAGSATRHALTKAETQAMIDLSIAGIAKNVIAATYGDLPDPSTVGSELYFVIDATGDPNVTTGGASYRSDQTTWYKFGEDESMDIDLTAIRIDWSQLDNGPSSTVTDIDDAVSKKHEHANSAYLDKVGETAEGHLQYDNVTVGTLWNGGTTTGW